MLKFHKGPTQTQTKQMGQSPIKKLKKKKNCTKIKISNPFSKIYLTHSKPRI